MEQTIKKILKEAEKENVDATISINKTNALSINYEKDELSNTSDGDLDIIQIRVSKGKKFGYSITDNLNKWETCFNKAHKLMKVSKPLKKEIILSNPAKYKSIKGLYSKKVSEMTMDKMFKKTEEAIAEVKDVREDISVVLGKFSRANNKSIFANTNGVNFSEKTTFLSSMIECGIGSANGTEGEDSRFDFDFKKTAKDAARLCVNSLDPKPAKTMKTELILDYFAASELLEAALVPSFMADNVQNNKSYLKGKLGKRVFSPKLSVVDDGCLDNGLYSGKMDSEGSPTRRTEIISKGILKNYLYDIYSAKLDRKRTTGNCSSITQVPSIGTNNLIIKKGDYSRDEIIEETKKGVLAKFVMGTHFVNPITGDASIGLVNAFEIEKGCITHPLKQAMMFVNIFDALKKLDVVGDNMRQDSSVICPTIKLPGVQIIS